MTAVLWRSLQTMINRVEYLENEVFKKKKKKDKSK